jgi:hypothetical protein
VGYEQLEFGHPPGQGRAGARGAEAILHAQELEHEWLSPSAPARGAVPQGRHRILGAAVAGVLVIGLAVAWTAHGGGRQPGAHQPIVTQPVRPVVAVGTGLTSRLTGPAYAPMLLLHNSTPHALQVGIGPTTSELSLSSDPALPVVIFAGQTIAVLLRMQTVDCSTNPAPSRPSSLQLLGGPVPTPGAADAFGATEATAIDLTGVMAYDRRRMCR